MGFHRSEHASVRGGNYTTVGHQNIHSKRVILLLIFSFICTLTVTDTPTQNDCTHARAREYLMTPTEHRLFQCVACVCVACVCCVCVLHVCVACVCVACVCACVLLWLLQHIYWGKWRHLLTKLMYNSTSDSSF